MHEVTGSSPVTPTTPYDSIFPQGIARKMRRRHSAARGIPHAGRAPARTPETQTRTGIFRPQTRRSYGRDRRTDRRSPLPKRPVERDLCASGLARGVRQGRRPGPRARVHRAADGRRSNPLGFDPRWAPQSGGCSVATGPLRGLWRSFLARARERSACAALIYNYFSEPALTPSPLAV